MIETTRAEPTFPVEVDSAGSMSLSLTPAVLRKYLNRIFIETGTYLGGGCRVAWACGFRVIHSMELSECLYNQAHDTLKGLGLLA